MIILSGLLVIVAIALLVAGIVTEEQGVLGLTGLQLIYVSIAVSIVSALCLAIGVLIRRKELFGPQPVRAVTPKSRPTGRAARKAAKAAKKAEESAPADEAEDGVPHAFPMPAAQVPDDALVHVVPGRKRYHLDTCRQLAGRQTEELTYIEAQEEGFSPCTACLPDTALAARATAAAAAGGDPDGSGDADFSGSETTRDLGPSAEPAGEPEAVSSFGATRSFEPAADDPAAAAPRERFGAHRAAEWSTDPVSAADTVTDWTPQGLTAEPVDPLDPAYPIPEDSYRGPSPLEPDRSGGSWSSPADPFRAEPGDAAPTPAQGIPLPDLADSPLGDSVLSEPVRPVAEVPSAPESDRAEPGQPLTVPAPQSGAPAEETFSGSADEPSASDESKESPAVRILSGTKRYHRPDCALIEDIGEEDEDLETISRDVAEERGCTPCLVCQPDKEPAV